MLNIQLPVWLQKTEIVKIKNAALAWWTQLELWLALPVSQRDADTCDESTLALLGWERQIDRFPSESVELYRNRVKYAFVNAQDAGLSAGFQRIMQRLGVGLVVTAERIEGQEWDVIALYVEEAQLDASAHLLRVLIASYGRTCRQYYLTTSTEASLSLRGVHYSHDSMTLTASL